MTFVCSCSHAIGILYLAVHFDVRHSEFFAEPKRLAQSDVAD